MKLFLIPKETQQQQVQPRNHRLQPNNAICWERQEIFQLSFANTSIYY